MLDKERDRHILGSMAKREGMIAGFIAVLIYASPAVLASPRFQPEVARKIDSLLNLSELTSANCGVAIYSLKSGAYLYERNSRKLFMPASNVKLVTTAAGLHYLGESFRFKTVFYHTGQIRDGKLEGDLIIKGYGDPTISNRFGGTVTGVLEEWADSIRAYGINSIKGNITADVSYFDTVALGPGWSWDDLSYWYAAEVSALNFNDNCVNLYFKPASQIGDPVQIRFEPQTGYINWKNYTSTNTTVNSIDYFRNPQTNQILFLGSIPITDTNWMADQYVSVHQPANFCQFVFKEVLETKEIKVKNDKVKADPYSRRLLFRWESHSLSEIVAVINKRSQNLYAECLLKTLGQEVKKEGSFRGGAVVLEEFLAMAGIPADQFRIFDGSGLSYLNLLSPYAITRLLSFVSTQPYFESFYQSLAVPGQDRSLNNRMKGVIDKDKMRLKTGLIGNSICLSGYVTDQKGNLYVVSSMFNNFKVSKQRIWEIQDAIFESIANHAEN
jgi:D-alanyl-D-alanine carboxypeptidase/D-alanyl-D-alanine-endopeptidase (penicillin-binding protein 4)